MNKNKKLGAEIEYVRKLKKFSIVYMCDALALSSEQEYKDVINGHVKLTVFQKIMLITATEYPYENIL